MNEPLRVKFMCIPGMIWNECWELLNADVDCDHYKRLAALFYYANYRYGMRINVRMINNTCFEVVAETFDNKKTGRLLFESDGFDYCERVIEINTVKRFAETVKAEKPDEAAIITFNELSQEALRLAKINNIRVVYFHPDEYERGKEDCLLFGSPYSRFEELTAGLVYENGTMLALGDVASNKELLMVDGKVWPLELFIKNAALEAKDKTDGKHCIRIAENSTLETPEGTLKLKWIDLNYEIKTTRKCYQIPVEWVNTVLYSNWDWDMYVFEENDKEVISKKLAIADVGDLKLKEISEVKRKK